jgi:hypothetical protein
MSSGLLRLVALAPGADVVSEFAPHPARRARQAQACRPRSQSFRNATPRTLLPRASRGGEKTPMPNCQQHGEMPADAALDGIPTV